MPADGENTNGKTTYGRTLELLDRRTMLLAERASDDAELADVTEQLRLGIGAPATLRLLQLDRGGADQRLARELARAEPVNPVADEADLRNRFAADRRVFVLEHPELPGRPMNVLWVALLAGLPSSLDDILDPDAPTLDPTQADTAAFYSIWNAQSGLVGLGAGSELLEQAVDQLAENLPHIANFVTLSPIPGLRRWLDNQGFDDDGAPPDLEYLAARYLTSCAGDGRPIDPVARFHMGNGARLARICPNADHSELGEERAWGFMASYRYAPEDREANRGALADGVPALGDGVEALLGPR